MASVAGTYINMTRAGQDGMASNTNRPGDAAFQFYTAAYASGTTQEWIMLPDRGLVDVTLSFDSAGSATIEWTDTPPDIVIGQTTGTVVPVTWDPGLVSATTSGGISAVAIRVNRTSGTPRISVAC